MSQRLSGTTLLVVALVLSGCHQEVESQRATCLRNALHSTPELRNGVAAYTNTDGTTGTIAANWMARLRLLSAHRYIAASLTKPRVAHVIKRTIDAGRLTLDTPVSMLLPEIDFSGEGTNRITVGQLLQHTSGLSHPDDRDPLWWRGATPLSMNCRAAIRYQLALPLDWPPGTKTFYSNVGYCLLGEIALRHADESTGLAPELAHWLDSAAGGAGAWEAELPDLHAGLLSMLPLTGLPAPADRLPDGSWYTYGWRWWPEDNRAAGAPWTHTGRLAGLLAIALTDGKQRLLVAHFDGDPADYHQTSQSFGRTAWRCMTD
ncbi:serine hydrolase domain-containing protein [Luteimonas sp. SDU101]|uniref:serine hydrolase domain-containing protein n=1 Tax=Luteimonas sp. SDU101 TaxID=3422593 RepID=UPI003EBE6D4A